MCRRNTVTAARAKYSPLSNFVHRPRASARGTAMEPALPPRNTCSKSPLSPNCAIAPPHRPPNNRRAACLFVQDCLVKDCWSRLFGEDEVRQNRLEAGIMNDRRSLLVAVSCPSAVLAGWLALSFFPYSPAPLENSGADAFPLSRAEGLSPPDPPHIPPP